MTNEVDIPKVGDAVNIHPTGLPICDLGTVVGYWIDPRKNHVMALVEMLIPITVDARVNDNPATYWVGTIAMDPSVLEVIT